MQQKHYIHFGMPRTGTTWIHYKLLNHPEVDYKESKENFYLEQKEGAIESHLNHYKGYKVSFNNNPMDWAISDETLSELDGFATHYGISFRNPYEFLHSMKNFMKMGKPPVNWVQHHIDKGFVDYVSVVERIKQHCKKPMLVMVMDDLQSNPQQYFDDLLDHIGLQKCVTVSGEKLNWRNYFVQLEFQPEEIKQINDFIDKFSVYMNRDFSFWKRSA